MDRLALYLSMLSWTAISGTLIVVLLTFGIYQFWWIVGAAAVALVLSWPSAYAVSRYVKNRDDAWNPRHEPGDFGPIPPRDAPEV